MCSAGPVTSFAAHAQFCYLSFPRGIKRYRAGGMTLETPLDAAVAIRSPIEPPGSLGQRGWPNFLLAGCGSPRAQNRIIRGIMLYVPVPVNLRNEGHSLLAGTERPFHGEVHDINAVEYPGPKYAVSAEEFEVVIRFSRQLHAGRERSRQWMIRCPKEGEGVRT